MHVCYVLYDIFVLCLFCRQHVQANRLIEAKAALDRLWQNVAALAEALDVTAPLLRLATVSADEDSDIEEEGEGLSLWQNDGKESSMLGPFGDEDSKAFYTSLPDLLASVVLPLDVYLK